MRQIAERFPPPEPVAFAPSDQPRGVSPHPSDS